MRVRNAFTTLMATAAGLAGLTAAAPAAYADAVCNGSPSDPRAYVCVVHVHPEDAFPTFVTGDLVEVPEICVFNACMGPTMLRAPGVRLESDDVLVVYWNNTCTYFHADGSMSTRPGTLVDDEPICPE